MYSSSRYLILLYLFVLAKVAGIVYLYRGQNPSLINHREAGYPALFRMESLPLARMFIEDSKHYEIERTPQSDFEWEALVPGNGVVYQDGQPKMPSMFHQLRCLDTIRRGVTGVLSSGKAETGDLYHHCVNYLREMVLCRGDSQLDPVYGQPRAAVFPHVYECKDWTAVYAAVEENQKSHSKQLEPRNYF